MRLSSIPAKMAKKESGFPSCTSSYMGSTSSMKLSCLCSPTNHAGSFRCRLHRTNPTSREQNESNERHLSHSISMPMLDRGEQNNTSSRRSSGEESTTFSTSPRKSPTSHNGEESSSPKNGGIYSPIPKTGSARYGGMSRSSSELSLSRPSSESGLKHSPEAKPSRLRHMVTALEQGLMTLDKS